jgi:hypothetical protein
MLNGAGKNSGTGREPIHDTETRIKEKIMDRTI